jgi:hypothetical protein
MNLAMAKYVLFGMVTKEAADIYEMLGYKKMPFWRKLKVCSTQ